MQIPVPTDQEANDALLQVTGGNFFLGITDEEIEGMFKNIYTKKKVQYENWSTEEPNNSNRIENYAVFINNNRAALGKWNDAVADFAVRNSNAHQAVCWKNLNAGIYSN